MPKISHVIGEGPELSNSQAQVLELLEMHPDHIFRMQNDDLHEIQGWLTKPDADEPPGSSAMGVTTPALGTIRWALSTLHARGKLGSIKLHRRTYYGSLEAIEKAEAATGRVSKVAFVYSDPDGSTSLEEVWQKPSKPEAKR